MASSRLRSSSPSISKLFLSFLKLGLTAFGGPAMIAYIKKMAVTRNKWIDETTFKDGVVLCQAIPGSTSMQMAAYVGLKAKNISGAFVSFVGFGLPAFILMLVLSVIYKNTHDAPKVLSLFCGLQIIVVALVAQAAFSFSRGMTKNFRDVFILLFSAILLWFSVSPALVILLCALLGLLGSGVHSDDLPKSKQANKAPAKVIAVAAVILVFAFAGLFFIDRNLFKLALLMFKIDFFAFGGGFGSLPLMQHEIVTARHWMDNKTFMDGIALGQVTPGPIVMTTTFIGYWLRGVPGAVVSTLAIFTPSFLMVVFLAPVFDQFKENRYFKKATEAIYASFVGLLLFVAVKFASAVSWDAVKVLLGLIALLALIKKADILYVVLGGAFISYFIL